MVKIRYYFCIFVFLGFNFSQSKLHLPTFSSSSVQASDEGTLMFGTVGQTFAGKSFAPRSIVLFAGIWGSINSIYLDIDDLIPTEFSLSSAYPNPFNPTVNIDFMVPDISAVNIQIYDLMGRSVFTHKQEFNTPGNYNFKWNGLNNAGSQIASGIYLVSIQYKTNFYHQKITFLK